MNESGMSLDINTISNVVLETMNQVEKKTVFEQRAKALEVCMDIQHLRWKQSHF